MSSLINLKLNRTPRLVEYLLRGKTKRILTVKASHKETSYFIPDELDDGQLKDYQEKMDWLVRYQKTFQKNRRAKVLAGNLRVFAELVNLKVSIESHQLTAVAEKLQSIGGQYFHNLAKTFFELAGQTGLRVVNRFDAQFEQKIPTAQEMVTIVEYSPRNEIDLATYHGYQFVESSFENYNLLFDDLAFKEKFNLLKQAVNSKNGDLYFMAEIVARPIDLHKLINAGIAKNVLKQPLSPYFGYDLDENRFDDSMIEMAEKCFDFSYQLFSSLQQSEYPALAQLAVLNGYRQRSLVKVDMSGLIALGKLRAGQNALYSRLQEKAEETFPQIYQLTTEV